MKAIDFEEKYYDIVCHWWDQWGFPLMPLEALPENGIMIVDGETPVCCAWIYKTDSAICWIEFYVVNKRVDIFTRGKALDFLLKSCFERAKDLGFKIAFSSVDSGSIGKRLLKSGFKISDENMVNYLKVL